MPQLIGNAYKMHKKMKSNMNNFSSYAARPEDGDKLGHSQLRDVSIGRDCTLLLLKDCAFHLLLYFSAFC